MSLDNPAIHPCEEEEEEDEKTGVEWLPTGEMLYTNHCLVVNFSSFRGGG